MPRQRSFNLQSEKDLIAIAPVESKPTSYVTVSPKTNMVRLSSAYIDRHDLDGKLIKFFVDTDKLVLAWKHCDYYEQLCTLDEYRKVTVLPNGGGAMFSLTKMLRALGFDKRHATQTGLRILSYYENGQSGQKYHYVQLNKPTSTHDKTNISKGEEVTRSSGLLDFAEQGN